MFEVLLGGLIGLLRSTQTADTRPQLQDTVNPSQPLTPNGPYRESVQLEPMSQLQFRNVIHQAYDYNCGLAALITLLDYHLGRNLEECQVMEGLLRYDEADKIVQHRGFSLSGMKRCAATLGYKSGGLRIEFNDPDALEHPALVPTHHAGFKHFMAVRDVYNDHVSVVNPALGSISFTRMRFEEVWNQNVLFVIFLSEQEPRNALALNDHDMCLVDDRIVGLLAPHESPQIDKIVESQVHEPGTGGGVIHLRTKQQVPKNKNNLWG